MATEAGVRWRWFVFALALSTSGAACGGDDAPACVDDLPATCTPGFTPAWASVYQNVIVPSCGANQGTSCHGPEGKQGGLEMSSSSGAYAALLGKDGTRARVIPEDPSCSILMVRLKSTDPEERMPRGGQPLSTSYVCSIQQWIQQGAEP